MHTSPPAFEYPSYETTLPVSGKKIKFIPFSIGAELILLEAVESKNQFTYYNAIKQIVKERTEPQLDIDNLAALDLDILYLRMRARTVGPKIDLTYKCPNVIEPNLETADEESAERICNEEYRFAIDLDKIDIAKPKDKYNIIKLNEKLGIQMRYPSADAYNVIEKLKEDRKSTIEIAFQVIVHCVEYIFDSQGNNYNFQKMTKEEKEKWIMQLPQSSLIKIQEFFDSIPELKVEHSFHCKKCGYKTQLKLSGMLNFFLLF